MGFTLNQLEQERQIRKLQKKEDKDTSNYEQLSNLPKINNVELKGDKTTSDLGINATNVMMSDGVTSVAGALDVKVGEFYLPNVNKNISIPDTQFEDKTVNLTNAKNLLFVMKVGQSPRGSLLIPYNLFTEGGDCFIFGLGGSAMNTFFAVTFRYVSDTKINTKAFSSSNLTLSIYCQ